MSSLPAFVTPDEYLEMERRAEYKSEYIKGKIYPMAGATTKHVFIVRNLVMRLGFQLLDRPFQLGSNDWRLRVSPTGLFTYPDVIVTDEHPLFADDRKDTILNPIVIIEVLSDLTRDYDRGRKFQNYRTLDSLVEYLTVEQDNPRVEQFTRQPENRWLLTEFTDLSQTIELKSIGCSLRMAEIYHKVG
jgi:Uma2 family endonuclease